MRLHPADSASPSLHAPGRRAASAAPHGPAGFTLMELLTAMFVATLLIGLVFHLFNQTQRGTRASLLRAQMSLTAQTMDARLRDEADGMLGPNREPGSNDPPAGCLLIVPALREGYVLLPNGQRSKNLVRLRSDQLVFFSQRNPSAPHPWVSLIPADGNLPSGVTSYEARIWYGALRDTRLDQSGEAALMANMWMVGRDLRLVRRTDVDPAVGPGGLDLTLHADTDYTPDTGLANGTLGGLTGVARAATTWNPVSAGGSNRYDRAGWSDDDYLAQLIGDGSDGNPIPNSRTNYTNQPGTSPNIDLKLLQAEGAAAAKTNPNGAQLSDLSQAHMRMVEHCAEIVVQWAGDLDKDGILDTYPQGHPLAGALIWYPEELHNSAVKDANSRPKLVGALQTKFDAIKNNDWNKTFPAGFAPALGVWPAGRFGDLPAGGWRKRFEFDYGEADNAPNQTSAAAVNVPAPYVFRFEDDQYRLVNYGFRQDGSVYANKFDGGAGYAPFPPPSTTQRHWTPFPPTPAAATTNPTTTQLYTQAGMATAPAGPYPLNAPTAPAAAAGRNFGDVLGDANLPPQATPPYVWPVADGAYRTAAPDATDPVAYPNGQDLKVTQAGQVFALGTNAAGTEPVWDPATDNPYLRVPGSFGPANNHSAVYSDLWRQWFKAVNDPAKQGTRVDWRNPQSDWPKLVRIRLRLSDSRGLVFSYSDEALLNGRDDDGDGVVDNREEARMCGVWYEYVVPVPYPMDPTPHGHGD